MVDQEVPGDGQKPGAHRRATGIEPAPRPQCPFERLLRQVFSVVAADKPIGKEPIDARDVLVVCLFEVQNALPRGLCGSRARTVVILPRARGHRAGGGAAEATGGPSGTVLAPMRTTRLPLYVDAVRHMRGRQLVGRSRRLVPASVLAAGLRAPADVAFTRHAAGLGADHAPQFGPLPDPAEERAFVALGHRRSAPRDDLWRPGPEGLLFMFHLHGFGPLAAYAAGTRSPAHDQFWATVVESWLDTQSHPAAPAWHPYPTSLRLIAWCSAVGAVDSWSSSLRERLANEIARQARYLRRAVEHDIGGNHVLKNATALVFAGVTVPASGVRDTGLRLLRRELARQILGDGGHEERSTSYHREVNNDLRDVAELLARADVDVPDWLTAASQATAAWQAVLIGPDGRLPMLNDAWESGSLETTAGDRDAVTTLGESGYVILAHGRDQALLDCGPLCPRHLPAHAHADALSFVLWMDGRLIIADPGSYTYSGPERARFRRTAAHATVEVDGVDQCVFWGDFRASFLPHTEPPRIREQDGVIVVESSHDGYRRLSDPVVHHRAFVWIPGLGLVIVDRLVCEEPHSARSSLPLSPGLKLMSGSIAGVEVSPLAPGGHVVEGGSLYSPNLGHLIPTRSVVEERTVRPGEVFGWRLLRVAADVELVGNDVLEIRRHGLETAIRLELSPLE